MRELTNHNVNGLNDAIIIRVLDDPGPGGANHEYILVLDPAFEEPNREDHRLVRSARISFQKGPIHETRVNGISNEALLAIVEDRLIGFQRGDFSCRENALALTKLQEALHWLHHRTRDRVARKVEGQNVA